MKNVFGLSLASVFLFVSCAGTESFEQKMSRYSPRSLGKNQVPELNTQDFAFTPSPKILRGPANANPTPTPVEKTSSEESQLSNKKLYFLTLFGQYEGLKKYASSFTAPNINICPHFHTSLLEHKKKKSLPLILSLENEKNKTFSYELKNFDDEKYVSARPELSLPLSKEELTPKVIDFFRSQKSGLSEAKMNEVVHEALDIHLAKTYAEIRGLCEFGVSDNYYIYENLITHIKSNPFAPDAHNMNTLLKTTIFSNLALLSALEKAPATASRSIASAEKPKMETATLYANEVMTRLNVEWTREYFNHLKSAR